MTGSALVPVIVPIVAVIALGIWLTLVYWADAHPGYKRHGTTSVSPARADEDAAAASDHGDGERVSSPPVRRAA